MKGTTTLVFSPATMIEIVQHYLDTVMLKQEGLLKVTAIKQPGNAEFLVEAEADEEIEEKKP